MKISSVMTLALCSLSVVGCQLTQNLQTDEAALVRRVLADRCVVGKVQSGYGFASSQFVYVRMGKVSKIGFHRSFQSVVGMEASRILVYSIQDLSDGWAVADAAYEGHRDNLYFNRQSGAFACSTDEWRAVNSTPKSETFEISPLILAPGPQTGG